MVKICLNMIVKNESKVITRCLDSVVDVVDAVIISDTGSSDNTISLIENWIDKNNKAGKVISNPWNKPFFDFKYNRNLALNSCLEWIDGRINQHDLWYIMFIDADDYLMIENKELFLSEIQNINNEKYDKYLLNWKSGSIVYGRTTLIKVSDKLKWKWVNEIHESISCDTKVFSKQLKNAFIQISRDGARSSDPMKYLKDSLFIESLLKKDPNNCRNLFYLAQSYRDYGSIEFMKLAEKTYLKRAKLDGWDQEKYLSYLEAAKCRMRRNKYDEKMLSYLFKAFCTRPTRLEAPYEILKHYRINKEYKKGYNFGIMLLNISVSNDILFVDHDIHKWKFKDELALCAFYSGDKNLYSKIYRELLTYELPENDRKRISEDLVKFGS